MPENASGGLFFVIFAPDSQQESSPLSGRKSTQATVRICGASSPDTYAERLVPLLVSPDLNGRSGVMFNNKAEAILPSPSSVERSYATALMDASDRLIARLAP
ncbi:hypothetical protein ABIF69_002770 [Bradyrhizobium japonicum]